MRGMSRFLLLIFTLAVLLLPTVALCETAAPVESEAVTAEVEAPIEAPAVEPSEPEPYKSDMYGTFWALVPPMVAIILALITKEVYTSLFAGILVGALFFANFNLETAMLAIMRDGMIPKIADAWNVGILIFLVLLGILVQCINKAGGSVAYGEWSKNHIKTRTGAQLSTFALGVMIFVDDYFNCLTVGSVMRPITDRHNISRAKLAYLIDATAAPVCMIAPISSWAAAVTGVVPDMDGLKLFISAIPYNFYSLLTIVMILAISLWKFDYGPMKRHENNAIKGDLYTTPDRPYANAEQMQVSSKGKMIDLVLPVAVLIVCCVLGMAYTGGLFTGVNIVDSFANCDAPLGLALGAFVSLLFSFVYFMCRRVLTFKQFAATIPDGFIAMVPAILILIFAWTLSAITRMLGGAEYVAGIVNSSATGMKNMLPAIVFAVACFLAFATGTSWGTFGILLPIVVAVFAPGTELLIISVSACLAGAVCGDHCSPISDTTIMSSTGAQCNHVNHVSTQLPYALTVAAVSFVTYIIAGFIQSAWIALPIGIALMLGILFIIKKIVTRKKAVA